MFSDLDKYLNSFSNPYNPVYFCLFIIIIFVFFSWFISHKFYDTIFNKVVNSIKIEPFNAMPLVRKKLNTQISAITKQSVGWREVPGIFIWLGIIFALVKITITDKYKHRSFMG